MPFLHLKDACSCDSVRLSGCLPLAGTRGTVILRQLNASGVVRRTLAKSKFAVAADFAAPSGTSVTHELAEAVKAAAAAAAMTRAGFGACPGAKT